MPVNDHPTSKGKGKGLGRTPVDIETQPFNLLTRTSGTVTARFRELLRKGEATQKMMDNAIRGTIEYLEREYGYEGYVGDRQENRVTGDQRRNGYRTTHNQYSPGDHRKITATQDVAQEKAFAEPNKENAVMEANYQCSGCGCLVQRTMSKCPGCGNPLHWERLGL